MSKPNIIIYRNFLLPSSETFIRSQVSTLKRFNGYYVGARRIDGLSLPSEKTITVRNAKLSMQVSEMCYRLSGISPSLYRQLRRLSPQLIHAHFGPDAIKAIRISKKLKLPLVVTFHGYGATVRASHACRSSYSQMMYVLKKRKLQSEATQFLAASDFIRNSLIQQGFSSKKIATHYIGIDPGMFMAMKAIQRDLTVLFVGRLVEVKGCEFLVRAMAHVQKHRPEVKLIIVGDGPLRSHLENLASQTLSNYDFLGFQPPSVVKEWMNKSTVFSVPSITAVSGHAEAFGIVFAEAQSMGLPVVSFDSGGISEVVEHGRTGFLAPEKDEKTLAEYILRLLEDRLLWDEMSQRAAKRIRAKFDIRQQTEKLEDIYSQIIATHRDF